MATPHTPIYSIENASTMMWLVLDTARPLGDARRNVARIYAIEVDEVEVEWLLDLPFPTRYSSPVAVIRDLQQREARSRAERPVPIPRRRPPRSSLAQIETRAG
jgi:hypothetical protein